MNAKKRAEKLVQKFMDVQNIEHTTAKQCAIISVDEIIEFVDTQMKGWLDWDMIAELKQVKDEIEKL